MLARQKYLFLAKNEKSALIVRLPECYGCIAGINIKGGEARRKVFFMSSISDGAFWRNVSNADVMEAIKGSFLEFICTSSAKNYHGNAPLPIILIQNLVLMGAALTGRISDEFTCAQAVISGESPMTEEEELDRINEDCPAKKSRVWIDTGLGNVPNVFGLLVAPSGAGKGINYAQAVQNIGYSEFSGGTLEGVMDAAIDNPHILINMPEFGAMLQGKGASVDKLKKGLTDMFSAGRFTEALSSRKSKAERGVEWFYPSVLASVQPEVLQAVGRSLDIYQGFFSRFLIGYLSENDMDYEFNPCNPDAAMDFAKISFGLRKIAQIQTAVCVADKEYNLKFMEPMRKLIDPKMRPVLERYGNEYLPRIALMLMITADNLRIPIPPILREKHFQRATVVLHRIFSMAEAALGGLTDLEGRSRHQENNLAKMARLLNRICKKKEFATLTEISRSSSGTGWDGKTRESLLNELAQRGWADITHQGIGKCEAGKRGAIFTLNPLNIPPGIL